MFQGDRNIALRKRARQSSTFMGCLAERAVDGNTDGRISGDSMAHTDAARDGNEPWWEVDLGSEEKIDRMVVWNRVADGCEARMSCFRIRVLDTLRNVVFEQFFVKAPQPSREIRFRAFVTTSEGGNHCLALRLRNPRQGKTARFRVSTTSDLPDISQEDERADLVNISNPWVKLAAAYHLIGGPKDIPLSLKIAALQAWFGQDKELAATRRRILASASGTSDAVTAERAARVCSIVPSTDKAELEAALALARKAVQVSKGGDWNLLALGMAEYRSGNDAAAEEALRAAAKAGKNNPYVTGISAFYRAMSLSRQGKGDQARKLARGAAAQMKPLPNHEQPFTNNASWDDLILWLACKEAKAMMQFDEAPPGKNGKK